MRTLVALLLLALALALLHHSTAGAPLLARATVSLGIVVLLAEWAGRVAARWGIPRVAAFVAIGIVCSPSVLGAVRPDEADALAFIGAAALALFVLRAGLALRGGSPAGLTHYLSRSIIVPFVVTAAVVFAAHRWFPLTVHEPRGDAVAVALALGAISVVAAPALTWTTLTDAPGGALPDALLRVHVGRELAVLPLFVAALAAGWRVTSPGTLEPRALLAPVLALGGSILAGGLLAWLASRLLRLFPGGPGVVWVGVGFGAAVAAWMGWGEVTLAALAAGLVLARLDRGGAELLRTHFDARGVGLASGAFALVGLGFDASALVDVWPWVLLLVLVRAMGLYLGDRLSATGWRATEGLGGSRGWLGLVSQGGLGVFLAAAGRRAFPEWGVSFEGLVVALVLVNAVVGPLCLSWAVARRPLPTEGAPGGT
jgi:Kef-type K+ transport system membrane component KefB